MALTTAAVFGSTGQTGQQILAALLANSSVKTVHTFSRRPPPLEDPRITAHIERDTSKWADQLSALDPRPDAVFSALGTSRAQIRSVAEQWAIDHDLNVELAKAAKQRGVPGFVFVSLAGADSWIGRPFSYFQMKKGVEAAVAALGFETAVMVRPGMILGPRDPPHPIGTHINRLVHCVGQISQGLQHKLGQEADAIGRAAVRAAQRGLLGEAPRRFWILENSGIVKLDQEP